MPKEGQEVTCAVTLKSLAPGMLLNPRQGKLLEHLFYGSRAPSNIGRCSAAVAEERLLVNDEGKLCLPSRYMLAALINAGRQVPYTRSALLTTERDSWVPGLLDLLDSELVLIDHDGSEVKWAPTKLECWLDSREHCQALAVRPRLKRWQMTVRVRWNSGWLAEAKVRQLFELAGRFVGLGDFRVGQNRRSRFGRFVVAGWEHVQVPLSLDAA